MTDNALQETVVGTADMIFEPGTMESLERFAMLMAKGKATVPEHLAGNPADCMAVVMQAAQWGMNPFAVAQKTHLVHGTLGYEAQLVNAVVSSSKAIIGGFEYEWFGPWEKVFGKVAMVKGNKGDYAKPGWSPDDEEGIGIIVKATRRGESEPKSHTMLLKQAQPRNSTLWATDPKQQLAYLAVKRWARLYTPGVILGVYTPDELTEVDITSVATVIEHPGKGTEGLKAKIAAAETAEAVDVETGEDPPKVNMAFEKVIADVSVCATNPATPADDDDAILTTLKDDARRLWKGASADQRKRAEDEIADATKRIAAKAEAGS